MPPRLAPALALLTLLAGGCGGSSGAPAAAASSTPPSPSSSPSAVPSPAPSPSAAAPALELEPDGLGVLVSDTSIRQLPFAGTPAQQATDVVTKVLGAGRTTSLPECGQGPRSSYRTGGLSLLLDGSRFVGWTDAPATGQRLSAADGTEVGMTLQALRGLHPDVQVSSGTLGPEFTTGEGGFGGFLSGTTPASTVTMLYAGETCFFR